MARIVLAAIIMRTTNTQTTEALVIPSFVKPNVKVRFTNVVINNTLGIFSLDYQTKDGRKKWSEPISVSGRTTMPVRSYFSFKLKETKKFAADNEKGYEVLPTGMHIRPFDLFIEKAKAFGYEYSKETSENVFESDNHSPDRFANPFELVRIDDKSGDDELTRYVLNMVNTPVEKRKGANDEIEYFQKTYISAEGTKRLNHKTPNYYDRLFIQTWTLRQLYQEPETSVQDVAYEESENQ